jgi:hypothetical protein
VSRRLNGARDVYGLAADNRFVTQMKDTFVFANQYLQINGVIMVARWATPPTQFWSRSARHLVATTCVSDCPIVADAVASRVPSADSFPGRCALANVALPPHFQFFSHSTLYSAQTLGLHGHTEYSSVSPTSSDWIVKCFSSEEHWKPHSQCRFIRSAGCL